MTRAPHSRPNAPAPAGRRTLARAGRALVHWMPVWIPLVLLAQVSLRGLRPALAERRRLDACEEDLGQRVEEHLERRAELEALHQALADPIYVERLRLERAGGGH